MVVVEEEARGEKRIVFLGFFRIGESEVDEVGGEIRVRFEVRGGI